MCRVIEYADAYGQRARAFRCRDGSYNVTVLRDDPRLGISGHCPGRGHIAQWLKRHGEGWTETKRWEA